MHIFKTAYKAGRLNSAFIYKGFGFKHRSDGSRYCPPQETQSAQSSTILRQPVAEAIILLADMLSAAMNPSKGSTFGDVWSNPAQNEYSLAVSVPDGYRENAVVETAVHSYKAYLRGHNIVMAAYDAHGDPIPGDMKELTPQYKLLPAFAIIAAAELCRSSRFRETMLKFLDSPAPDTFVALNSDLCRKHENEEFCLRYSPPQEVDESTMSSLSSFCKTIRENKTSRSSAMPVEIVRFATIDFPIERQSLVPRLPGEFELPTCLRPLCNAIQSGDVLSALFHGPAGTGKSMSCKLICQSIGLPVMETVNCTENLDEFVLGKFLPMGDRIEFRESQVTQAIREGGAVVFEEINFAKPQYLAFLNSLLDDNGFVRLDNGEVVQRHPRFRFFATMNLGYFGTKELNQALYNRFNAIVEVPSLADEAIEKMLLARVPECAPVLNKMLAVYHRLKKRIESDELDAVVSPRNLENWARLAKYEGYVPAAEKSIVPIAKCDRALEQIIRDLVVLYKWT